MSLLLSAREPAVVAGHRISDGIDPVPARSTGWYSRHNRHPQLVTLRAGIDEPLVGRGVADVRRLDRAPTLLTSAQLLRLRPQYRGTLSEEDRDRVRAAGRELLDVQLAGVEVP